MGLSACKASLLVAVLLAASLLPRGLGAAPSPHTADGGDARRLIRRDVGDGEAAPLVLLRGLHGAARPLLHGSAAAAGASVPSNGAGAGSVSRQSRKQGGARRRPVARRVLLGGVSADASKPSCGSNYVPDHCAP